MNTLDFYSPLGFLVQVVLVLNKIEGVRGSGFDILATQHGTLVSRNRYGTRILIHVASLDGTM